MSQETKDNNSMIELKEKKHMVELGAFLVGGFTVICICIVTIYYAYAAIDWLISKVMGV